MAEKINVKSINPGVLAMVSKFNVAYKAECAIRAKYSALIKNKDNEIKAIIEKRAKDSNGLTDNELVAKYPTVKLENEKRALEVKRDEELKPYKDDMAEVRAKAMPKSLFVSFKFAFEKQNASAMPGKNTTLAIGKKEYVVERSFMAELKDLCKEWGLAKSDNANALTKFANAIILLAPLSKKSSKGAHIESKTESQCNDAFLLTIITYALKNNLWVESENGELSVRLANA